MAATDPDRRRTVAAEAGRVRAAGDPDELFAVRGAGGRNANSILSLAKRVAAKWPDASRAERAEVREILGPLMPRPRPAKGAAPTTE